MSTKRQGATDDRRTGARGLGAAPTSGYPSRGGGRSCEAGQAGRRVRLKFIKSSYFFLTEVPIRTPYCECKACPYRFVPQTSCSVEQFGRGLRGSGFPLRSRFFAVRP